MELGLSTINRITILLILLFHYMILKIKVFNRKLGISVINLSIPNLLILLFLYMILKIQSV